MIYTYDKSSKVHNSPKLNNGNYNKIFSKQRHIAKKTTRNMF